MRSPDELLLGGALGGGADDQPALGELEALADRLQALALVVLEPARDADPVAVRRVDEEAARERDLRRQPRALRAHRVLDGLDEHLLAAGDELLDALAVALALELRHDDLVHVEEAVAVEADVDERRLHPREDVVDDALVDVPGDRAMRRASEVDLGDLAVLEHRHASARALRRRSGSPWRRPGERPAAWAGLRAGVRFRSRFGCSAPCPWTAAGLFGLAACLVVVGAVCASTSTAPVSAFFLRPRPPRLPRRRRAGFRSASAASCRAGSSRSSASGAAASTGASSPRFFRRNQVNSVDSFRAHAALGAVQALAEPQGVCHKSHVISAPELVCPEGWLIRAHLPQVSSRGTSYAAAGRNPVRFRSTARKRWLRRAQAHGSTSS